MKAKRPALQPAARPPPQPSSSSEEEEEECEFPSDNDDSIGEADTAADRRAGPGLTLEQLEQHEPTTESEVIERMEEKRVCRRFRWIRTKEDIEPSDAVSFACVVLMR